MTKKRSFFTIATILFVLPVLTLFYKSFTQIRRWGEEGCCQFTLMGYRTFSRDPALVEAIFTSVFIALLVVFLNILIGVTAGKALAFYSFRGKSLVETLFMLPLFLPTIMIALGLQLAMIRVGLADTWIGVSIVHLLPTVPYSIKIMLSGYERLGTAVIEQAKMLGASPRMIFRTIELPGIRSSIRSVVFLSIVISLSQYVLTSVIGGGNVKTLAMLYYPFTKSPNDSVVAAFSIVFALLPLVGILIVEVAMRIYEKSGFWTVRRSQ
ncbi:hypothetical protein Q73_15415 [Bacillus coahuilensis m2-6]|uniref:ABC transporter permease n=1 Tax=Bacillus coahuilensis TaxID=408580 RepID=UPI000750322F|nr:ABC transporter permease subunit [Bacillus coahuilensis]KUP04515.1 hypothetical protein Q73_15415 [Bacillus coahuilensis m2-6]